MTAAQDYFFETLAPDFIIPGLKPASREALEKRMRSGADKAKPRNPTLNASCIAFVQRKDVVFKFPCPPLGERNNKPRSAIKGFSHSSRRRLTALTRNTADIWTGFLTLTYPSRWPNNGKQVKAHLNTFCQWLRRQHVAYVWILEFQERGAPHFHFLVSGWLPRDSRDPETGRLLRRGVESVWHDITKEWDTSEARYCAHCRKRDDKHDGFVREGNFFEDRAHARDDAPETRTGKKCPGFIPARAGLVAGTRIEAVKNPDEVGGYMASYMGKLEQKIVPEKYASVGRFWGASKTISRLVVTADERGRQQKRVEREPLNPKQPMRVSAQYADVARASRLSRRWFEAQNRNQVPKKLASVAGFARDARGNMIAGSGLGFRWRWKGHGFTMINGAQSYKMLLRAAVLADAERPQARGAHPLQGLVARELARRRGEVPPAEPPPKPRESQWRAWNPKLDTRKPYIPDSAADYMTPLERLNARGQLGLGGDVGPAFEPLFNTYDE